MVVPCNNEIIKYKETYAVPKYFQLQAGWAAKISFWGQRRVEYFENKIHDATVEGSMIKVLFDIAIFGIPALVGKGLDCLVHSIKAEKISKNDYQAEFNEWMTKEFHEGLGGHDMYKVYKNFIDFCIRNKIKAKDCPHQHIIYRRLRENNPHYLFSGDGCAPDVWKQHFGPNGDNKNPSCLVLWSPHTTRSTVKVQDPSGQNKERKFAHLSSQEIRDYYKRRNGEYRAPDLINRCAFTVFATWTYPDSKIIINNVRQAVQEKFDASPTEKIEIKEPHLEMASIPKSLPQLANKEESQKINLAERNSTLLKEKKNLPSEMASCSKSPSQQANKEESAKMDSVEHKPTLSTPSNSYIFRERYDRIMDRLNSSPDIAEEIEQPKGKKKKSEDVSENKRELKDIFRSEALKLRLDRSKFELLMDIFKKSLICRKPRSKFEALVNFYTVQPIEGWDASTAAHIKNRLSKYVPKNE